MGLKPDEIVGFSTKLAALFHQVDATVQPVRHVTHSAALFEAGPGAVWIRSGGLRDQVPHVVAPLHKGDHGHC